MSYLNHAQNPRGRAAAASMTVAIHAAIGLAVVTGLSVAGYKPLDTYKPIIDFPVPPPPPEPAPPEKAEQRKETSIFVAPVPLPPPEAPRDWPSATDEPTTTDTSWLPVGDGESENLSASSSVPPFNPKRATPSNNSSNWITNDDYPRRALVDEAEGSVGYRLVVSTLGRVASCELTRPSGNRALDDATCRLITRRARFEAATDETGAKVLGTYSGSVRWEIPE